MNLVLDFAGQKKDRFFKIWIFIFLMFQNIPEALSPLQTHPTINAPNRINRSKFHFESTKQPTILNQIQLILNLSPSHTNTLVQLIQHGCTKVRRF